MTSQEENLKSLFESAANKPLNTGVFSIHYNEVERLYGLIMEQENKRMVEMLKEIVAASKDTPFTLNEILKTMEERRLK